MTPAPRQPGLLDSWAAEREQGWGADDQLDGEDHLRDDPGWAGLPAAERARLQEYQRQRPPHHGD